MSKLLKSIGRSSTARRMAYCTPRPVFRTMTQRYFGEDLARDPYADQAHRVRAQLSYPYPLNRLLRGPAIKGASRLAAVARTLEQQHTARALLEALETGQVEQAARMAGHCSHPMDTGTVRAISRKHQFVYFGTPRVASCSIANTLHRIDPEVELTRQMSMDAFCSKYMPEINQYFTFGFARHPLERLWACWEARVVRGQHYGLSRGMDFPAYCKWIASPWGADAFADKHWLSQHNSITTPYGKPLSFTGRAENLDEDWPALLKHFGMPHRDLAHHHESRPPGVGEGPGSLDSHLIERLQERYAEDFRLFGYGAVPG